LQNGHGNLVEDWRKLSQEEKDAKAALAQAAAEKEMAEKDEGGLAAYQGVQKQSEGGEMTEQEATMLLEGYKGEEATGRAVKMRRKTLDIPEPVKNW
jgi:hypothetical protein